MKSHVRQIVAELRAMAEANSGSVGEEHLLNLAVTLATALPVPANKVSGSAKLHYTSQHEGMVRSIVDAINEEFMLDYNRVLELVRKIYIGRYSVVHTPTECLEGVRALLEQCIGESCDSINVLSLTKLSAAVESSIQEAVTSEE